MRPRAYLHFLTEFLGRKPPLQTNNHGRPKITIAGALWRRDVAAGRLSVRSFTSSGPAAAHAPRLDHGDGSKTTMVAHISSGKPRHGKVPFWHIPAIIGRIMDGR